VTLIQLQYLRAVCKHSNITKAASELHITQPSISKALKDLEDEFGIRLFYRLSKGLSLTGEGRLFLEKADKILDTVHSLEREMRDLGNKKKEITIGIPPMIGTILFPHMFSRFHALYPDVRLSILEYGSLHTRNLVEGSTLDAAIVAFDKRSDVAFECVKIMETETLFCVSEQNPLAQKDSISINELVGQPLVLFKEDSYQSRVTKGLFRGIGVEPNVILYSSQLHTIRELVVQNIASTVLFRGVIDPGEGIKEIPFETPIITDIYMIWNRGKHLYSNLTKLIDFTREYKHETT
jgi:DNA-binding transcriptional LysR family regulator